MGEWQQHPHCCFLHQLPGHPARAHPGFPPGNLWALQHCSRLLQAPASWGCVCSGSSYICSQHQGRELSGGFSDAHKGVLPPSLPFSLSHTPLLSPGSVAPCQHIALPPGILRSLAWLALYSPGPIGSFWFHSCLPFRHKTCRYHIFHSLLGCCFAFLIIQGSFK